MNYARLSSLLCATLLTTVLAASCTSTHDTADVVPSPPGAFQPDAGGALVDEDTACAALTSSESKARAALGCDAVKHVCPSYVRPAGGEGCFVYDQASLDGCEALYDSFTDCADFDQRPCLLTAESKCGVDSGSPPGAGGAGGQASVGAGGEGAASGESGMGGASAAGSPG
jgi:hypothetical protein